MDCSDQLSHPPIYPRPLHGLQSSFMLSLQGSVKYLESILQGSNELHFCSSFHEVGAGDPSFHLTLNKPPPLKEVIGMGFNALSAQHAACLVQTIALLRLLVKSTSIPIDLEADKTSTWVGSAYRELFTHVTIRPLWNLVTSFSASHFQNVDQCVKFYLPSKWSLFGCCHV